MDDREYRLLTLLVLGTCAVSVGLWSWVLHEAFGWLTVAVVAVCGHLWVLTFSPHRLGRHVGAVFVWGMVAAWLWLTPTPRWPLVVMLAFPVGIQSAMLALWVAFEVPHRWRRQRSSRVTPEVRPDAEPAATPDTGRDSG